MTLWRLSPEVLEYHRRTWGQYGREVAVERLLVVRIIEEGRCTRNLAFPFLAQKVNDCREVQHVSTTGELGQPEWARLVARLIGTGRRGAMSTFTPARTNDRWSVAANSSEYCSNFLASEFVSAWRGGRYSDFEKCLHVQEALRRYGILDALVTMVALFLVCLSISAPQAAV